MQWHQLDHMQTICTSFQTDNHTNTLSVNFYRPDALPEARPTVKCRTVAAGYAAHVGYSGSLGLLHVQQAGDDRNIAYFPG